MREWKASVSYTHLDVYKRQGVDLVITGEGRMDWQSAFGKVPSGIGKRCRERGIPVAAIVGGMGCLLYTSWTGQWRYLDRRRLKAGVYGLWETTI